MTYAVIGAKEGTAVAITAKVGARVTDAVLCTADGIDYKSTDEYELYELVAAAMQAAGRPTHQLFSSQTTKRANNAQENADLDKYITWAEDKRISLAKRDTSTALRFVAMERAHDSYPTKAAAALQRA